jgi:hypothetical protein
MLNEALPKEIFEIVARQYSKVFEGVNSDEDDAAGWSSENEEESSLPLFAKTKSY